MSPVRFSVGFSGLAGALACLAALSIAGCGSGSGSSPVAPVDGVPLTLAIPPVSPFQIGADGAESVSSRYQDLLFTLTTPKRTYARGEQVPLTLTVQNTGTVTHTSSYRDISRVVNGLVYSQSGGNLGEIVPQPNAETLMNGVVTYQPGATQTFPLAWYQQAPISPYVVAPGIYRLRAFIVPTNLDGKATPDYVLGTGLLEIEVQ